MKPWNISNMRRLTVALAALLLLACRPSGGQVPASGHRFEVVRMLPITPVKDQGANETCWIYAMLAVVETEHLVMGDSVSLSVDYVARQWLTHEGRKAFNAGAKKARISMRGVAPMTLRMLSESGVVPFDSYNNENANFSGVAKRMARLAGLSRSFPDFADKAQRLMDEGIGALPATVYMYGFKYTPQEFARSVCRDGEYVALCSTERHPYGELVDLELPDNQTHERFMNLPVDSLLSLTLNSIREGHPVLWEGDISEPGFSFSQGVADTEAANRQQELDTNRTTDDHCMAIVGLATDPADHRRWFIVKNSWGKDNPYGGLMYLSEDYFRMKTVAIVAQSRLLSRPLSSPNKH